MSSYENQLIEKNKENNFEHVRALISLWPDPPTEKSSALFKQVLDAGCSDELMKYILENRPRHAQQHAQQEINNKIDAYINSNASENTWKILERDVLSSASAAHKALDPVARYGTGEQFLLMMKLLKTKGALTPQACVYDELDLNNAAKQFPAIVEAHQINHNNNTKTLKKTDIDSALEAAVTTKLNAQPQGSDDALTASNKPEALSEEEMTQAKIDIHNEIVKNGHSTDEHLVKITKCLLSLGPSQNGIDAALKRAVSDLHSDDAHQLNIVNLLLAAQPSPSQKTIDLLFIRAKKDNKPKELINTLAAKVDITNDAIIAHLTDHVSNTNKAMHEKQSILFEQLNSASSEENSPLKSLATKDNIRKLAYHLISSAMENGDLSARLCDKVGTIL